MIKVTDSQHYRQHLVNPSQIVRVTEADSQKKYHGTRCHITLTDGMQIDCSQTVEQVQAMIEALSGG